MNDLRDNSPKRKQDAEDARTFHATKGSANELNRVYEGVPAGNSFRGHPNVYCTIVNSEDSLLLHFIAEHMTRGTRTLQELSECLRNYRNDGIDKVTNRILTPEKELDARLTEGEKLGQKYANLRKERDLFHQQTLDHQMNIGHLERDNERLAEEIVRLKGLLDAANKCVNEWSASAYQRGEENSKLTKQLRDKDIELQKSKLENSILLKQIAPGGLLVADLKKFILDRSPFYNAIFAKYFTPDIITDAPPCENFAKNADSPHLTDKEYYETQMNGLRNTIAYLERKIKERAEKSAALMEDNQLLIRIRESQAAFISSLHKKVLLYAHKYGPVPEMGGETKA